MPAIACPNCHKKLNVPEKYAGRSAKCPACQKPFPVEFPKTSEEPPVTTVHDAVPPAVPAALPSQSKQRTAFLAGNASRIAAVLPDKKAMGIIGGAILVGILVIVLISSGALTPSENKMVTKGLEAMEKNDFDLAISCFNESIRVNSKCVDAYKGRSDAYMGKHDAKHAAEDLTRAIELRPQDTELLRKRADAFAHLFKMAPAINEQYVVLPLYLVPVTCWGRQGGHIVLTVSHIPGPQTRGTWGTQ